MADNIPNLKDVLAKVLIPEEELMARIKKLGEEISKDYKGEDILLICILRGGVMFMTDLMKYLTVPNCIDFMSVSSYGAGARETTGTVRITLDLRTDIFDRNVLIVEDIIDSGNTLSAVLEMLSTRKPKTIKICTLLDKKERRETEVPIDYVGFSIPNEFVFGYGLDLDEYYRNLPYIGVVDLDHYTPPD